VIGMRDEWRFQASFFTYEDGSSGNFLGAYPMEIRWIEPPEWPLLKLDNPRRLLETRPGIGDLVKAFESKQ
jgi:hypothetical protein